MFKVIIAKEEYQLCEKCGFHKKPESFRVKKQKRKSCSDCRTKK